MAMRGRDGVGMCDLNRDRMGLVLEVEDAFLGQAARTGVEDLTVALERLGAPGEFGVESFCEAVIGENTLYFEPTRTAAEDRRRSVR
jgi:hypothetical protein